MNGAKSTSRDTGRRREVQGQRRPGREPDDDHRFPSRGQKVEG